jgi:LacI family transcriptional regulator
LKRRQVIPARRRSTSREVAREAGVSVATVSRTFNSPGVVHPDTRRRVLEAAERVSYAPSMAARTLSTGRSGVIGVVVSDIEIPFFVSVARAIQDLAHDHGYQTLVANSDELLERERELLDAFESRLVDGLIVSPASGDHRRLVEVAKEIPVVLLDRVVTELRADAVLSDNVAAARAATSHLLELGHRRIGYATDKLDKTSTEERLEGYVEAHREWDVAHDPELVWVVDYHPHASAAQLSELLARHEVTGLVAAEGNITLGALLAARDRGLAIPDDLSLVGFDELLWSEVAYSSVTVVSQDTSAIGAAAMRLLLERLDPDGGEDRAPMVERVPTSLTVRDSCRAVSPDNRSGRS